MSTTSVVIGSVILCVSSTFVYKWHIGKQRLPLPPSPKGDPILGHLRYMPTEYEEAAYKVWGDELGSSIISVNLLGQVIIVLNSIEDANELLVKRALQYSNRFQIPMLSSPRLTGWGNGTALLSYNDRWRGQRRVTHEVLQKKTLKTIWPSIVKQTRLSMQRMPDATDFEAEIARMVGAVVLQSAYGYEVTEANDRMVEIAKAGMKGFSDASMPADFLVNANGTALPSTLNTMLTELANNESKVDRVEEEDRIKWAIGSLYAGAMDTTTSSILVFMLAMIHNPNVQARAQEEVDAVVGDQRLPEMEDQDNLPYVGWIIKEVLRWRPVVPLGVPHACAEDDMYKGYFIPKDAVVMGNAWAMCYNPEIYADPERFNPDRFMDPTTPDPPAFGFGRRICPGQHFAEASLFLAIATMLSVFDIKPATDKQGHSIIPDTKLTANSLIRFPFPFKCLVKPRSEAKRGLLFQG
ncbi:unnamed protein product [Rhizoctonia solani]|uniref:O-methylsterigmatocystin oxidoreductase n=1 Tax=Rhizoctonia solani TaxID=456999 RepID=A0A8H2XKT6_9AGAM|nr:unnamed protein product [Rhizoctonia solani]